MSAHSRLRMAKIASNDDSMMMPFYNGDPNMVKHVWQMLFHVREATLHHEGGSDFVLAHLDGSDPELCGTVADVKSECTFFERFLANLEPPPPLPPKGWNELLGGETW